MTVYLHRPCTALIVSHTVYLLSSVGSVLVLIVVGSLFVATVLNALHGGFQTHFSWFNNRSCSI